jgi:hypothetical protein
MTNIVKRTISFGLACFLSLIIISLFVLVYGYTGVHIENATGATDYKWMPNQYKATMTEGFAWMKFDSEGFNNITSIVSPVDVLLMGSSHMEAVNLPSEENAGALLNQMLPSMNVYNIGVSGHTIYQCANNLHNAVKEYSTASYIIIETDTVNLENDQMLAVLEGTLNHIPSYTSGIVYLVQRYCPAIKSLYKHIEDWRGAESRGREESVELTSEETVLDRFLSKIVSDADGRKVIIIYHPLTSIDSNGKMIIDPHGSDLFESCCVKNGIVFVDMTKEFQRLYDSQHILAHGFINTAVGVGHLNSYGHDAIAEQLAEIIMEDQKP